MCALHTTSLFSEDDTKSSHKSLPQVLNGKEKLFWETISHPLRFLWSTDQGVIHTKVRGGGEPPGHLALDLPLWPIANRLIFKRLSPIFLVQVPFCTLPITLQYFDVCPALSGIISSPYMVPLMISPSKTLGISSTILDQNNNYVPLHIPKFLYYVFQDALL